MNRLVLKIILRLGRYAVLPVVALALRDPGCLAAGDGSLHDHCAGHCTDRVLHLPERGGARDRSPAAALAQASGFPRPPFERVFKQLADIWAPEPIAAVTAGLTREHDPDATHPPFAKQLANLGYGGIPEIEGFTPPLSISFSRGMQQKIFPPASTRNGGSKRRTGSRSAGEPSSYPVKDCGGARRQ